MAKAKIVKTEMGDITARELTVGEVRDVLDELSKTPPHVVDLLFGDEHIPAVVIARSTEIPMDSEAEISLMSFTTSDMRKIIEAVGEVNPDFLGLSERIGAIVPPPPLAKS
ncbi:MAG: hypothetical protein A2Y38_12945 [Spirochaetes bacterium GWB1_59_5]|nr:MAG: hypothetical protein A2Y38_12945 [Spirochaetes bacterium GWB1_59_5]